MPADKEHARVEEVLEPKNDISLEHFANVEWDSSCFGPELADPVVLQRIEAAVLNAGARVHYAAGQEIIWHDNRKRLDKACSRLLHDQQGVPFSVYDELRRDVQCRLGDLNKQRNGVKNVHRGMGTLSPNASAARRLNAIAERQFPTPKHLAREEEIVAHAKKAFKRAVQIGIERGQVLAFRRTDGVWEMMPIEQAIRIPFAKRIPQSWTLSFLISGELPESLTSEAHKGGPKGTLRSKASKFFRNAVAEHPTRTPWDTRSKARQALREQFPEISKNMADEIWKNEASDAMKRPGKRPSNSNC